MKKFLAAFTTALLAVGIAVVGVSAPATAVTPSTVTHTITSTCTALTVNLSGYADTVLAVPAVPATYHDWAETVVDVPAIPAKPAVTHTEDLYYQSSRDSTVDYKWFKTNQGSGWTKVSPQQEQVVIDKPAQDAVPAVTHQVSHHDLLTPEIPTVPAKTNSVVVSIDGHQQVSMTFGTGYSPVAFPYPADFQTHTYSVQVTAWNGDGTYSSGTLDSGACKTAPVASLDHVGACYGNNGFSSENVYVKLDNTNSQIPVTFTSNGINATVAAGATQVAEATPMWNHGGSFDVTAAGKSFNVIVPAFADCGASTTPYIQGPWVGTCQLPATTRTVEFWFDNTGSNRDVTYVVGSRSIVAPAGQKVHFNADAAPMAGATYVITAGSKSWSMVVPASDCLTAVTPLEPTSSHVTCGIYPTLTLDTTPGVHYVTTSFNPTTGKYKVIATPELGYKFPGGATSVVLKGQVDKLVLCIVGANPHSNIIPTCGAADVWLSNDLLTGATTKNKTYTAKIYVDGVLRNEVNVKSGVVTSKSYTFGEDSLFNGSTTHTITVTVNGHQIADNTVESDCLPNVAAANPHSNIVATCGAADVYISNDFTAGHNNVGTDFDADIYVDGVLTNTVFVAASSSGAYTTNSYPFAEDSTFNGGTIHTITVSALGHQFADNTVQSDCALNVAAANPHSNIVTTVCGTGDVYISNDFVAGYNNTGTDFDAEIYVDNALKDTVTVPASSNGAFTTNDYSFAEDSGNHVIQVKVGGTLVMQKTVVSDCVANPTLTSTTPTLAARTFAVTPPTTTPTTTPTTESLTTLALLPSDATATDEVCTSNNKAKSGYISVALLPEDTTAVQYSIDGTQLASATTKMKPGSYTVTASARDSGESVATTSWNLTIASADCAQLTTLAAQTTAGDGAGFPIWALLLVFFLLLLLAGIVFFLIARRRRNQADAN